MNIIQLQDMLKFVPDDKLKQELSNPNSSAPQYLILSEVVRRDKMREAGASKPSTTVVQDILGAQQQAPQGQMPQAFASGGFVSPSEAMGSAGVAGYPTPQPKMHNPISASTGIASMFSPNANPAPAPQAPPQTNNNVNISQGEQKPNQNISQPQPKFDDGQSNNFDSPSYYEQGAYADGGVVGFSKGGGAFLNDNAKFIAARLAEKGYSPAAISAILSTGYAESSFNPAAVGKAGELGTFQWRGDRRNALNAFAKARGTSPTDLATQVDFLDNELKTTESRAGTKLLAAKTPQEAATAMMHFERPAGYSVDNPTAGHNWKGRLGGAVNYFEQLFRGTPVGMAGRETTAGLGQGAGREAIGLNPSAAAVQPSDVRQGGIFDALKNIDTSALAGDVKSLGSDLVNQRQAPLQFPDVPNIAPGSVAGLDALRSDPDQLAKAMADYRDFIGGMASGGAVRMADGTPKKKVHYNVITGTYTDESGNLLSPEDAQSVTPEQITTEPLKPTGGFDAPSTQPIPNNAPSFSPTAYGWDKIFAPPSSITKKPTDSSRTGLFADDFRATPLQLDVARREGEKARAKKEELSPLDKLLNHMAIQQERMQQLYEDQINEEQARQAQSTGLGAFLRRMGIGMLTNNASIGQSLNAGFSNAATANEEARQQSADAIRALKLKQQMAGIEGSEDVSKLVYEAATAGRLGPENLVRLHGQTQQAISDRQMALSKMVESNTITAEQAAADPIIRGLQSELSILSQKLGLPASSATIATHAYIPGQGLVTK